METYEKTADNKINVLGVIATITPEELDQQIRRAQGQSEYYQSQADAYKTQADALIVRRDSIVKTFPDLVPVKVIDPAPVQATQL